MAAAEFHFHPELFEFRAQAQASLSDAGFEWLSHYGSVDIEHERFGLEVCGIRQREDAVAMMAVLEHALPGWECEHLWLKDYGREPGWMFTIVLADRADDGDGGERVG